MRTGRRPGWGRTLTGVPRGSPRRHAAVLPPLRRGPTRTAPPRGPRRTARRFHRLRRCRPGSRSPGRRPGPARPRGRLAGPRRVGRRPLPEGPGRAPAVVRMVRSLRCLRRPRSTGCRRNDHRPVFRPAESPPGAARAAAPTTTPGSRYAAAVGLRVGRVAMMVLPLGWERTKVFGARVFTTRHPKPPGVCAEGGLRCGRRAERSDTLTMTWSARTVTWNPVIPPACRRALETSSLTTVNTSATRAGGASCSARTRSQHQLLSRCSYRRQLHRMRIGDTHPGCWSGAVWNRSHQGR